MLKHVKTKLWLCIVSSFLSAMTLTAVAATTSQYSVCDWYYTWNGSKECIPEDCSSGDNCGTLWVAYECFWTWSGTCTEPTCGDQGGAAQPAETKQCGYSDGNCICD